MSRLFGVLIWTLVLPVLSGCRGTEHAELNAYLAVVDSVSEKVIASVVLNAPEGANVCFASTFWPGNEALPGQLQNELTDRGWTLYDPGILPSPGTWLVFVSQPASADEGQMVAAGYQVWQAWRDEVTGWGDYWDFRMECRRNSCSITEAYGKNHYDLSSTSIEEYMAKETGVCAGSVPGLMEGKTTADSGDAASTVPQNELGASASVV
jgi:hypothetical protein